MLNVFLKYIASTYTPFEVHGAHSIQQTTDSGYNGDVISWDFGDRTPVSNHANPTHTYAASGSYNVCVTVTNGCGSNTACQTINTKSTGINNIPGFPNISIYPNPTRQKIMIDNAEAGTVPDIYNTTGSLVLHTK